MRSFTIGLLFFLSIGGYTIHPTENPDLFVVGDSLFIRKTLWPDTEKDELVIFRNGEVIPIYTMYTADGSSVEFLFSSGDKTNGYDCFDVYNAAADGSSFLFYTWPENHLYITYGIYTGFDPIPESVDFVKQDVLLKKRYSTHVPKDTLDLGNRTGYFISESDIIRVECKEIWRLP
ncbi:MAG: hypothetical protein LUG18_02965 [Candidatus Azobacteroides sp.]|nr:hypothetical protein [Candidatus Azobacteroides sp.]